MIYDQVLWSAVIELDQLPPLHEMQDRREERSDQLEMLPTTTVLISRAGLKVSRLSGII